VRKRLSVAIHTRPRAAFRRTDWLRTTDAAPGWLSHISPAHLVFGVLPIFYK